MGGVILAPLQARKGSVASVIIDVDGPEDLKTELMAAAIAQGAMLRHYAFKKYQTKKSSEAGVDKSGIKKLIIHVAHHDKAKAALAPLKAVANGVNLARDLVNEPANILGPVELAEKTKALEKLGVEVQILDVKAMEKRPQKRVLVKSRPSYHMEQYEILGKKASEKREGEKPQGQGTNQPRGRRGGPEVAPEAPPEAPEAEETTDDDVEGDQEARTAR